MEIGQRIRQLRGRAGITQEQLGEKLGVTAQSISKWETGAAMPDITLLPRLAEEFGVTIDELFDLTNEQRLRRIESRMEQEAELSADVFREYEDFLKAQLAQAKDRQPLLSLLANLYNHRAEADLRRVSRLAREATLLAPEKKDCQWLLDKAEGAAVWDWNMANHSKVIDFFKEVIRSDNIEPHTPLPYYFLIDNLLADNRADEAEAYVEEAAKLPAHKPFLIRVYRAHVALARFDRPLADEIIKSGLKDFSGESGMHFEAAQYYARTCRYDRAIECYEASYRIEEDSKPRFTDALYGIMAIYEIQGKYDLAVQTCDRILLNLREEWGMKDEQVVLEALAERERLAKKI